MKIQFGGLKLKNPDKSGFDAVYDMIEKGKLQLFTYKSLKGFMMTLDVSEDNSEYFTLNKSKFTKPVTSFILKFAIITPNNDETLPKYNEIKKASESKDSFYEEAKLQQHIWKSSITGGRPEICPPVANFSLFDNNNSNSLLQFLQDTTKNDKKGDTKKIFDYLFDYIDKNKSSGIGIIVMPKVEMSTTFDDFIDNQEFFYKIKIDSKLKELAQSYVAAQISRLFIDIGVIHFDLHMGNALIYLTPEKEIRCLLIDFGRASNIMNNLNDDYLDVNEKDTLKGIKEEFFNSLFDIGDNNEKQKKEFILEVLNNIAFIDHEKNQEMFNYSNKDRYQMDWYNDFPKETNVPVNTFNILKNITYVEGLQGTKITPDTIKSYERQGFLINFNRDASTFFVPFSPLIETSDNEKCPDGEYKKDGACIIMGGKRKKTYRTHKKQRKTRRTKKN
jgi:hypothetical protein